MDLATHAPRPGAQQGLWVDHQRVRPLQLPQHTGSGQLASLSQLCRTIDSTPRLTSLAQALQGSVLGKPGMLTAQDYRTGERVIRPRNSAPASTSMVVAPT